MCDDQTIIQYFATIWDRDCVCNTNISLMQAFNCCIKHMRERTSLIKNHFSNSCQKSMVSIMIDVRAFFTLSLAHRTRINSPWTFSAIKILESSSPPPIASFLWCISTRVPALGIHLEQTSNSWVKLSPRPIIFTTFQFLLISNEFFSKANMFTNLYTRKYQEKNLETNSLIK